GNVGAGQIKAPLTNLVGVDVKNERSAVGGRDEQGLDELREQAPAQLRCRSRAVTREDFRALAVQAGGVVRAEAFPLSHPDFPDANPVPSQDLIRSVCQYLDQFRLVTTEVYVKKANYIKVIVKAAVRADPQVSFKRVRQDIVDALNTHLDPLGRTWTDDVPG